MAAHITASFPSHRNVFRLVAQVDALVKGNLSIPTSHRIQEDGEVQSAVRRHQQYVDAIAENSNYKPTIGDLQGQPIELVSILDPAIEKSMEKTHYKRVLFHSTLLSMEKKANEDLAKCIEQYGYHWIFRAGLTQYYMTKCVVSHLDFWNADSRSRRCRMNAQNICYEAMDAQLKLNDVEKRILIEVSQSRDTIVLGFWNWLSEHRNAYHAMKACLFLLNKKSRQKPAR
ncbi:hypothetical protein ASPZODRAFT_136260 [Penicilliopsis zonata CBS 506.65]|uniref:Uncharacterized protein n=1 Tax=Penicilliopsis zonata CBS 506.65 TaxID=1073090 RepID=A0A1L9S8B8_9EURO|nr:hypothetical protein ASPZODRAFT_136260 [Penicilliopsis zonata CBS 506.65]OJJ43405.1 hypothetical protein ASPZODRAFT_136260 [Penicilliopsis zonata CBS 506.65]